MATKFVRATNKRTGETTKAHDTDSPAPLFKELAAKNSKSGEKMDDWKFDLLAYNGERIGTFNWREEHVSVTLGDLFD